MLAVRLYKTRVLSFIASVYDGVLYNTRMLSIMVAILDKVYVYRGGCIRHGHKGCCFSWLYGTRVLSFMVAEKKF